MTLPIVILGIVLASMAYIHYSTQLGKKRTDDLRQVAQKLGFEFMVDGKDTYLKNLIGFHGESRDFKNLMRGVTNDLEVAIFDYRFTSSGRGDDDPLVWNQTAVCFRFDGAPLPEFTLRPESLSDKLRSWVGFQDFDFERYPDFSRKYRLRGSDEQAVRALFTSQVLDFYEQNTELCTDCLDNTLLVYRRNVKVSPENIRSFMKEAFTVRALFRSLDNK